MRLELKRRRACAALAAACALTAWAAPAEARPQRIVSLDYCADQFVLGLADRTQIAAVSRGAGRDDSFFRDRAQGLAQTRGVLEEVVALRPDLIVRNWGGDADVYRRLGYRVLQVGDAVDFRGARAELLHAAETFGQEARGRAIAEELDQRLSRLAASAPSTRPDVLYLTAGGASAGRGTLMDAVINSAGARNVQMRPGWSVASLEQLMTRTAPVVALGFFETGQMRATPWTYARHPALRSALAPARQVRLDAGAISCQGWFAIHAAEQLSASLRRP